MKKMLNFGDYKKEMIKNFEIFAIVDSENNVCYYPTIEDMDMDVNIKKTILINDLEKVLKNKDFSFFVQDNYKPINYIMHVLDLKELPCNVADDIAWAVYGEVHSYFEYIAKKLQEVQLFLCNDMRYAIDEDIIIVSADKKSVTVRDKKIDISDIDSENMHDYYNTILKRYNKINIKENDKMKTFGNYKKEMAENFKNYVLVENGMEKNVFSEKDIEVKIPMYSANAVLIRTANKVTDSLIAMLNQTIIEDGNRLEDRYDVQDFTDEHLQNAYAEYPNDYENPDDSTIVYDFAEDEFSAFADWAEGAIDTITYLDSGSNWKTLELDAVTYVTTNTDSVDLDEYDGSNWYTGGKFEHQNVYKVYQLDGKKATNIYLVITGSDYQGTLDIGEIMTEGELIEHLRKLGRDVEKYMKEVQAL